MIISVDAILLDVEGTTSSIQFVYEQMFPYARKALRPYCCEHWNSDGLNTPLDLLAVDAGFNDKEAWFDSTKSEPMQLVTDFVEQLMDSDSKATGLKSLQGLLWKSGFESGELKSHLFDDVADSMRRWHQAGLRLAIYSSGSVTAQRLFYGHTVAGDLNSLLCANFDTQIGSKRSKDSYQKIAQELQLSSERVLFLTDVVEEVFAAEQAGMKAVVVVRPGNVPLPESYSGPKIESFEEIKF